MKKDNLLYITPRVNHLRSLGYTLCFSLLFMVSCKKIVEVDPPVQNLVGSSVYSDNTTASSVLTGIYSNFQTSSLFTNGSSISIQTGLVSDELTNYYPSNITLAQLYTNSLQSSNGGIGHWIALYKYIYVTNDAIEGITKSPGISQPVKDQLIGEAKFLRAFFYFYLVNFYGDVPLITSTDYQLNQLASRAPAAKIYQQIIDDLKDAQSLLNVNYVGTDALTTTTERTIPNQAAVSALLARVYLYTGDWANAEQQSSAVIGNSAYNLESDLNNVFLANNNEAIWQLQPNATSFDTYEGYTYILISNPNYRTPVALSSNQLDAFESGDMRLSNWVKNFSTYSFPYKYKIKGGSGVVDKTEYYTILRLAEQYLIRAEAEANGAGGGEASAVSDLNMVRTRAGLPDYAGATDKASLLTAILHERQVELFTEWGHRWFDLKRTGTVDSVMSVVTPLKGGTWSTYKQLFPLLQTDINLDGNLTQNTGY